jgi:protein-L-isoaspartate(D-aspartate) O-methyltransferase
MTFDFRAARLNMVESQIRTADVTDLAITDALRLVPRESLLPPGKLALAYADCEVEYAPGLSLMRPREIGKLLQALQPRAGERALAIAAPYGSAVLEAMGLTVHQVSGEDLTLLPSGTFDVVLSEGAVTQTPASWTNALAEGGRLGVVERAGPVGKARLYVLSEGRLGSREVFDATPPYLPGLAPQPQFVF